VTEEGAVDASGPKGSVTDEAASTGPSPANVWLGWPTRRWALLLPSIAFVVYFAFSVLEYLNFETWQPADVGVFQQGLSSVTQGYHPALYESFDCVRTARCSFLLVHPSFILYGFAPVFAIAPSPLTLYAIQALAVAGAAIPVYAVTRQLGASGRWALATEGLYLVLVPVFVDGAFSFHMESFLPLELLGFFWLWLTRRYALGAVVAFLAFITLEITPIYTFFFGLFFIAPALTDALVGLGRILRAAFSSRGQARDRFREWRSTVGKALRLRSVQASLALMAVSVLAYFVLRLIVENGTLIGLPALPLSYQLSLVQPNPKLSFTLHGLRFALVPKLTGIVMLFALVGFLPFLVPRSLILALPGILYTLFTYSANTHRFGIGNSHSILPAFPLILGVAYAVTLIESGRGWRSGWTRKETTSPAPVPLARPRPRRERPRSVRVLTVIVGVVLVANVVVSPLNPFIPEAWDTTLGYRPVQLTLQPGFTAVDRLLSLLPPNAVVVVPTTLMPLVADDVHAIPVAVNVNLSYLPFTVTGGLPEYVVLEEVNPQGMLSETRLLPTVLPAVWAALRNASEYGVRGYALGSLLGPVLLYQAHYVGPPTVYGTSPSVSMGIAAFGSGLAPGPAGMPLADNTTYSGIGIVNISVSGTAVTLPAKLAQVDYPTLYAGTYNLTVSVKASTALALNSTVNNTTVLRIHLGSPSASVFTSKVPFSTLDSAQWVNVSATVVVPYPLYSAFVQLIYVNAAFTVEINYVSLTSA
jgi:uncharacterized membrane protein